MLSYTILFTLDSQFVLFRQIDLEGEEETVDSIDIQWEIKNVYFQTPLGLLIEDAVLNENGKNKLYDVYYATQDAELTADQIKNASIELLEIIETCPDGDPCCDEMPMSVSGFDDDIEAYMNEMVYASDMPSWIEELQEQSGETPGWVKEMEDRFSETGQVPRWVRDVQSSVGSSGVPGWVQQVLNAFDSKSVPGWVREVQERVGSGGKPDWVQEAQDAVDSSRKNPPSWVTDVQESVGTGNVPSWVTETQDKVGSGETPGWVTQVQQEVGTGTEPVWLQELEDGIKSGNTPSWLKEGEREVNRGETPNWMNIIEREVSLMDDDNLYATEDVFLATLLSFQDDNEAFLLLMVFMSLSLVGGLTAVLSTNREKRLAFYRKTKKNSKKIAIIIFLLFLLGMVATANNIEREVLGEMSSNECASKGGRAVNFCLPYPPHNEVKIGRVSGGLTCCKGDASPNGHKCPSGTIEHHGGCPSGYEQVKNLPGHPGVCCREESNDHTCPTGTTRRAFECWEHGETHHSTLPDGSFCCRDINGGGEEGCFWSSYPPGEGSNLEVASEGNCPPIENGQFPGHLCLCPIDDPSASPCPDSLPVEISGSCSSEQLSEGCDNVEADGESFCCCPDGYDDDKCPDNLPVETAGPCTGEQIEEGCDDVEDVCCCPDGYDDDKCPDNLPVETAGPCTGEQIEEGCDDVAVDGEDICCCPDDDDDDRCPGELEEVVIDPCPDECQEVEVEVDGIMETICCCDEEMECEPGETQCEGDVVMVCVDGFWEEEEDCKDRGDEWICEDGECVLPDIMCPPCPDIAPPVQAKIEELEEYMNKLANEDLPRLLATKEPLKEDLYNFYKVIMLKSLGYQQVISYNDFLVERLYYESAEVALVTDEEQVNIGPYYWDWSQWLFNITYRTEVGGDVREENDPATFYFKKPQSDIIIEDALRLAQEAKENDIQLLGKGITSYKKTDSFQVKEKGFLEKLTYHIETFIKEKVTQLLNIAFAETDFSVIKSCLEGRVSEPTLSVQECDTLIASCAADNNIDLATFNPSESEAQQLFSICGVEVEGTPDPTGASRLSCGMEIPIGEAMELAWDHLMEILDTIDEYEAKARELIEKQEIMNELSRPCECPCEGDEECLQKRAEGEEEEEEDCGECVLTCDLDAIREAHQEVLITREELREIAEYLYLLTDGFYNEETEDLCHHLNEDIRSSEEHSLCEGGGSRLITMYELITRKLNYSRSEFNSCLIRPEMMEDVLTDRHSTKELFFAPIAEELDLPRYTKQPPNGGVARSTSNFNWYCCSSEE